MENKLKVIMEKIDVIIAPGKKQPLTYIIMGKPKEVVFNPHTNQKAMKLEYTLNPLYWTKHTEKILEQQKLLRDMEKTYEGVFIHFIGNGRGTIELYITE